MTDFLLDASGDLKLSETCDISPTESVAQAVRIRLLWFFKEWRLMPDLGFPYFEYLFVKNPNLVKIRSLIRETVLSVDEVTDVKDVTINLDSKTRKAVISVTFSTDEDTFREEVELWHNTA